MLLALHCVRSALAGLASLSEIPSLLRQAQSRCDMLALQPPGCHCIVCCRIILLYLVPTVYRFKYYFAWAVAEAGLTMSGFNYDGVDERGVLQWDRYVNTRIRHVEFQTSLAKLPEHWNVCTGLFLRQCKLLHLGSNH